MACKFTTAAIALEWWRAGGDKTPQQLTKLVDHWLHTRNEADHDTREATLADALANRHTWEM